MTIYYKEGYEYQLVRDYSLQLRYIRSEQFIYTPFVRLDTEGVIYIAAGYAWDGPSGPALDTPDFMCASLVHDALYQLLREGWLPASSRKAADREMQWIAQACGMNSFRAWYSYNAVRLAGGPAASEPTAIIEAPAPQDERDS